MYNSEEEMHSENDILYREAFPPRRRRRPRPTTFNLTTTRKTTLQLRDENKKREKSGPYCIFHARGYCCFGKACKNDHSFMRHDRIKDKGVGISSRDRGTYVQSTSAEINDNETEKPPLCKFYLKGTCRKGSRCYYSHSPAIKATAGGDNCGKDDEDLLNFPRSPNASTMKEHNVTEKLSGLVIEKPACTVDHQEMNRSNELSLNPTLLETFDCDCAYHEVIGDYIIHHKSLSPESGISYDDHNYEPYARERYTESSELASSSVPGASPTSPDEVNVNRNKSSSKMPKGYLKSKGKLFPADLGGTTSILEQSGTINAGFQGDMLAMTLSQTRKDESFEPDDDNAGISDISSETKTTIEG